MGHERSDSRGKFPSAQQQSENCGRKNFEIFSKSDHWRSAEDSCSHHRWLDEETTNEHRQELVEWVAAVAATLGTKTLMQQY